jgi:predicted RNA-binding Zn ribbon-like protein
MVTYMSEMHESQPEPTSADELFVEFANTLEFERDGATDALPDIDSLLNWLRRHDLISERGRAVEAARLGRDSHAAEQRLERFRFLRQLLHEVAGHVNSSGSPTAAQVRELNHILRHGLHYHQLRREKGANQFEIAQIGDRLDQARAGIANSLAHYLADHAPDRLRICANPTCRWVFVDRSPTGHRRWCDMRTCGNQAKVARHRARAKRPKDALPAPGASV